MIVTRRLTRRSLLIAAALVLGAGTAGSGSSEESAEAAGPGAPAALPISPGAFEVDAARAAEFLAKPPEGLEVVLLDVRTPGEIKQGHVTGAEFLDYSSPAFRPGLEGLARDRAYLVFCHSGGRSARAAKLMRSLGIEAVWNVKGGVLAWSRAGLPLEVPAAGE